MSVPPSPLRDRKELTCQALVLAICLAVAAFSAQPYTGSWNDGSRLATVECLVDYHTLAIDRSIFVHVPPPEDSGTSSPYPLDEPDLLLHGTGDKLWIHGHYYSDKSPVPALLLAGVYQGWQWCTGATARQRPDSFCYWMTLASSGLCYVIAVYCIFQLGGPLGLSLPLRLALTASFALATVALPYVRQVNNHILLLGVAAPLFLVLERFAVGCSGGHKPEAPAKVPRHPSLALQACVHRSTQSQNALGRLAEGIAVSKAPQRSFLALGSLAGLGYTIDLVPALF